VKKLREMDVKAALEVIQLDITQDEQIDAAAEWVKDKFGRLDGG
jgi:NAD(P)-dependent dehydrogenase (short-subunit alcohol dehydrogenase family)